MSTQLQDRKLAHAKIKHTDWFLYFSPALGQVSIQRDLIEPLVEASGLDALDAAAGLAHIAAKHINRLEAAGFDMGQSEELLQKPLRETYHVLLLDGQAYISNEPFYQYPNRSGEPLQPHKHRAGRNDPCPCGSGVKYKKCCLNRD